MSAVRHLSPASAEILRAVIIVLRPRGHGFDQPIDEDILAEIDRTLPCFPRGLQLGLPLGLRLLEWGPILFTGRAVRFTQMEREDATRYLADRLESQLPPVRILATGLRALVLLSFFQHPLVLEAMGVRWDRRVEEAVQLRAASLTGERA